MVKKLSPRKHIEKKEVEYFGDVHVHKLPSNIVFDPEEIGEFTKSLKPHHHKTAIKKVHKHIVGTKPRKQVVVKQVTVSPGVVPRNIGLFKENKVYLWVTGDSDYIMEFNTIKEADAYKSKMIGMGYYARYMRESEIKQIQKTSPNVTPRNKR